MDHGHYSITNQDDPRGFTGPSLSSAKLCIFSGFSQNIDFEHSLLPMNKELLSPSFKGGSPTRMMMKTPRNLGMYHGKILRMTEDFLESRSYRKFGRFLCDSIEHLISEQRSKALCNS